MKKNGFTLIELIVVVSIISYLGTIFLFQASAVRAKARDAKRAATINQLQTAIYLYYEDNGYFPGFIDKSDLGPYLPGIPTSGYTDPLTGLRYNYGVNGNGSDYYTITKFQIWAEMEKKNNSHAGDADINGASYTGGSIWGTALLGINATLSPTNTEACNSPTTYDCIFDLGIQ